MRAWIKKVMAVLSLDEKKDQPHQAYILQILLIALLTAIGLHGGFLLLLSGKMYSRIALYFNLPAILWISFSYILLRLGNTKLAAHLTTGGMWLIFTFAATLIGGVNAPIFVGGYMIIILMAGIVLGLRISVAFTIACLLSTIALGFGVEAGWIVHLPTMFSTFSIVFVQVLALAGTFALVRLYHYSLYRSLVETDIETARRENTETILAKNERRYTALLEYNQDMVAVINASGHIQYISPSVSRILGFLPEQVVDQSCFDLIHPEDISRIQAMFADLLLHPGSRQQSELRVCHADHNWRWVDTAAINKLNDPDIRGVVINYRDITDEKHSAEIREHNAIHDSLTGLCNRLLFVDRIENQIRRSQRMDDKTYAVILLDIDHFKNINDSLGHEAGDQLLIAVAQRLETCVRTSDTVARLGGDEFGILLNHTDGPQSADLFAARIEREVTRESITISGRELIISVSIGIVLSSHKYQQPEEYLRDAEIAMYRAKALGRSQHIVFEERMRLGILERVGLEAELRRALEKQEFVVYYQPVYSLVNGGLAGFEALVRWRHPTRKLLLPGEFIDVAEESGLIVDIDRWVMNEACRQMREWQLRYPESNPLIINVNLSRRQLIKADLIDTVMQILAETGMEPGLLRPEITENLIMENIEFATNTLKRLDKMGVRAEIDDFGSGYSSLAVLTTLPIRTLKIDRSFITSIGAGGDRYEVIRTIVALGHSLGMEVIAEGIETNDQLQQLCQLGCEYGQGFLFSHGLSAGEAEALIATGLRVDLCTAI